MSTIISEAQFILEQLLGYIDNPGDPNIQWPKAILDDKQTLEVFKEALSIIRAILLESEKFQKYYCSKHTPDASLNENLKQSCAAITDILGKVTQKNLDVFCASCSQLYATLLKLGGGFLDDNDLTALAGAAFSLATHCSNFQKVAHSLEAVDLAKRLDAANKDLADFKQQLDKIAATVEKAAEIAAFLDKAVTLLAKIIPFIV